VYDENSIMKNDIFRRRIEYATGCETVCLNIAQIGLNNLFIKLKELSFDILITTDLTGFEQATLTDNISYNLLDCKQIHLLLHDKLPNEHLLEKQLSIAMFFYCTKGEYYEYLVRTYNDIPFIQKIAGWKEGQDNACCLNNADIISSIINYIKTKCAQNID
jgi:hypothetical protein